MYNSLIKSSSRPGETKEDKSVSPAKQGKVRQKLQPRRFGGNLLRGNAATPTNLYLDKGTLPGGYLIS
jgi:hypothetical protein